MSRKTWIILIAIVLLIAAGGAYAYYFFGMGDDDGPAAETVSKTGVVYQPLPTDHTMGNPHAKVTVIEYASPTCPICARFMLDLFPKLKSDYIDKGRIFYVYRTFLRNPDDGAAEKLARCQPRAQYMSFTDALFRDQQKWDYEYGVPEPDGVHAGLVQVAQAAGMSADAANRCIADKSQEAAISKVGEDGVAKYAIEGTPTFVINGQGKAGFEDFFSRLDAALGK